MNRMTKILVADDSAMIHELFHDLFVSKGYEVFQAFDGREAISLFDSRHPDVVLLDIERESGGYSDLFLNQVNSRGEVGHRMLDL